MLVDRELDYHIEAESIYIKGGSLKVGNASHPFTRKFTIQINGNRHQNDFKITDIIKGEKLFVVTGTLALYGLQPGTVFTHLTKTAAKGSKVIYVGGRNDWKVGEYLSISPSFSNYAEGEEVKI